MPRDDFSPAVIKAIAARSGYRCAHPNCRALTIGPSDESPKSTNNIGVACHITAASSGGPRFEPGLTPERRASADNGIWMCGTHARDIDNDVIRFSIPTLRAWKLEAEARARQDLGRPFYPLRKDDALALQVAEMTTSLGVNSAIGDAIENSGARASLGDDVACAIRDLLIEVARNAFEHGGATLVTVSIEPRRILLIDNGGQFNPTMLPKNEGSGGRKAVEVLREHYSDLVLDYKRENGSNRVTIVPLAHMPYAAESSPCTLTVETTDAFRAKPWAVEAFEECGTVFVSLPPYLSISDIYRIGPRLRDFAERLGRELVLIISGYSVAVLDFLQGFVPAARLVRRKENGKKDV